MRTSLRVVVLLLTVLVSSIGLAMTTQAAPGPGPGPGPVNLPAGSYHFTTVRANFIVGTYPNTQFSIYVTDTTRVSNPLVGAATTTRETELNLNLSGSVYGAYCFMLSSPSDFTVTTDLRTATLNTTINATTPTCYASYPGPPVTVNVTWTGTGPVAKSQSDDDFKCGSYSSESTTVGMNTVGNATAKVTPGYPNGVSATLAGFGFSDQQIQAEGVSLDTCGPALGGGKGAGFGPRPPGGYQFVSLIANANFQLTSGGNLGIFVSKYTNTLRPDGSPTTITSGIDLSLFVQSGFSFGAACFVIPAADFTSTGVQTAVLHTTVDSTTTPCPDRPSFGNLPLPLKLDVTWTGVGPVSTLQSNGHYSCETFSQDVENVIISNRVNISGTATTPAFTDNFASQGTLMTADTQLEIKGVQSQACLVRG